MKTKLLRRLRKAAFETYKVIQDRTGIYRVTDSVKEFECHDNLEIARKSCNALRREFILEVIVALKKKSIKRVY